MMMTFIVVGTGRRATVASRIAEARKKKALVRLYT